MIAQEVAMDSDSGYDTPLKESSYAQEFRRRSSTKTSRRPLKTLMDEEMSKERFQKTRNVSSREKWMTYDERSIWMSNSKYPETSKVDKHKNQKSRKGVTSSKYSEPDMAFTKSKHGGNSTAYSDTTEIVVLKPSLPKALDMLKRFPSTCSQSNSQVGHKRNTKLLRSGTQELYLEGNEKHELAEVMRHKTKGPIKSVRELAEQAKYTAKGPRRSVRELAEQAKYTAKRPKRSVRELAEHVKYTSSTRYGMKMSSKYNDIHRINDISFMHLVMDKNKKPEKYHQSSNHLDDRGNRFGASSSVIREATKLLYERWRMTRLHKKAEAVGRGAITLAEMLALSEKGKQKRIRDRWITRGFPKKEAGRNDELLTPARFVSRSNDRWNNRCSSDLPKSSSSSIRGVQSEYHDQEKKMNYELLDHDNASRRRMVEISADSKNRNVRFSTKPYQELVKQTRKYTGLTKETSAEHSRADFLSSQHVMSESGVDFGSSFGNISETGLDKVDKPSPVSVIEALSNPEKVDCLQNPAMHLEVLKLESSDQYTKELNLVTSDEERDFSYLLDMIIESGVHDSHLNILSSASPEDPVSADVFERLEKKYSSLESWSKNERELLFYLINSALADSVLPYMDMHPWVNPEGRSRLELDLEDFAVQLWQIVVSQRKKPVNLQDKAWLIKYDLGNDIDLIGGEIERMLMDDLLKELVSQLILKQAIRE